MRTLASLAAVAGIGVSCSVSASEGALGLPTELFTFDQLPVGLITEPVTLNGDLIDVTMDVGENALIIDWFGYDVPASWPRRTLVQGGPTEDNEIVFTFEGGATGFSFEFGDPGGDADTITVEMYSGAGGTGTLIDTLTVEWGTRDLSVDGAGLVEWSFLAPTRALGSIVIDGDDGRGQHTLYYDNLTVIVPAPGPAALAFGLLGMTAVRRR